MYSIYAFYEFFYISNIEQFREKIFNFLVEKEIKGTILIATEGINGTIAGLPKNIEYFVDFIKKIISEEKDFSKIKNPQEFRQAYKSEFIGKTSKYGNIPFLKTKVKIKKEIVSIKLDESLQNDCGSYIEIDKWDDAISDKNALVIDNRNTYEYELGTFENAVNPNNKVFSEFPDWIDEELKNVDKDTKIVMFCTGGVRCEKSTRIMEQKGFNNVYHLKGGILEYLQRTKNKNSKWKGKCFVFDDRYAVSEENA